MRFRAYLAPRIGLMVHGGRNGRGRRYFVFRARGSLVDVAWFSLVIPGRYTGVSKRRWT